MNDSEGIFDVFVVFIISILIVSVFDIEVYVNSLIGVTIIVFIASAIWIIVKVKLIKGGVEL